MAAGAEKNRRAGRRQSMPVWLAGLGAIAGFGAAVGGYALFCEPFDVRTERLALQLLRQRAGLPAEGLRILHLSDTHFRGANRREQAKIAQVGRVTAGAQIDLLIHTGDFLHNDHGLENVLALIDIIPKPRLGAFAVTGNHDHVVYEMKRALHHTWRIFHARESERNAEPAINAAPAMTGARSTRFRHLARFARYLLHHRLDGEPVAVNDIARLRRQLEERGMQFLDNRAVRLEGTGVYLVGIEDLREGRPDLHGGLRGVPHDAPTILLSHNPDIIEMPATRQADLILAGHTHGGQIVLPLVGPAYTQTEQLTRSEASGYWRRGQTHVYVHRGLGESIPVRFGAPPHVTFLTLLPARPPAAAA